MPISLFPAEWLRTAGTIHAIIDVYLQSVMGVKEKLRILWYIFKSCKELCTKSRLLPEAGKTKVTSLVYS